MVGNDPIVMAITLSGSLPSILKLLAASLNLLLATLITPDVLPPIGVNTDV